MLWKRRGVPPLAQDRIPCDLEDFVHDVRLPTFRDCVDAICRSASRQPHRGEASGKRLRGQSHHQQAATREHLRYKLLRRPGPKAPYRRAGRPGERPVASVHAILMAWSSTSKALSHQLVSRVWPQG
jgi:hypothetical protein